MSHECDDCGLEFDTLTRLRLHDCRPDQRVDDGADQTPDKSTPSLDLPSEDSGRDHAEFEREYPDLVAPLPDLLDDAEEGNLSALSRALAEYEQILTRAARGDTPGDEDLRTDLQFAYYEPLADGLDAAAETHGWAVLIEYAEVYDPHEEDKFPEVGHVIANAIGRSVIRTRQTEDVATIPDSALAFLGAIPKAVDEFHVAHEESYTYGWGINHPEHAVGDTLLALAKADPKFVKIALNTAFYVDQHAALEVFERIVTEDSISGTRRNLGFETDLTEFYFQAVANLETEELLGPHAPPYWDEADNLPRVVEVDPDVKQRIRDLALDTGIATELPANWSLHDLDVGVMSEMLDLMDDRSDRL